MYSKFWSIVVSGAPNSDSLEPVKISNFGLKIFFQTHLVQCLYLYIQGQEREMEKHDSNSNTKCKILTVGDGDLTLSLALARAYGTDHVSVTASVLDSKECLLESFPDAPLVQLEELQVQILYGIDATQLHHTFPLNHWDLVLFHHPHLGLASLSQDEAHHATRHYQLLCHYLFSAGQVAQQVHVCLCGSQRETWRLDDAAQRQGLQLLRELSTTVPFSKVWTDRDLSPVQAKSGDAAPRRYRSGKLGSRHFLGKYGYRHRRTAGERYHGGAVDMNVAGSIHYVFQSTSSSDHSRRSIADKKNDSGKIACPICGASFACPKDLDDHLIMPAVPQLAEMTNLTQSVVEEVKQSETDIPIITKDEIDDQRQSGQGHVLYELPSIGSASDTTTKSDLIVSPNTTKSELIVSPNDEGKRLRSFLQHKTAISKRQAEVAVLKGNVYINGVMSPDSSRILRAGMIVEVLLEQDNTGSSSEAIPSGVDILYNQDPFLVVNKVSGIRTKGNMQGTLEFRVSQQQGCNYESLSNLDTSSSGVCVMMPQASLKLRSSPKIIHYLVVLVHGAVPDSWYPNFENAVSIQRKWKQKKRKHNDHEGSSGEGFLSNDSCTITIVPLERITDTHSNDKTPSNPSVCLSTIRIQTEHPSAASICQWMRHLGYPVVGDMNCRKEYLQLKRSIRNRIKNKLCLTCSQVQWTDESTGRCTQVPMVDPLIPEKLSAVYWESNFT